MRDLFERKVSFYPADPQDLTARILHESSTTPASKPILFFKEYFNKNDASETHPKLGNLWDLCNKIDNLWDQDRGANLVTGFVRMNLQKLVERNNHTNSNCQSMN